MLNFFTENLRLGLKNLGLHKLRSLLTALGIIIGVAAVIVMIAIGEGAKQKALEQMTQLGATNVLVRSIEPPKSDEAASRQEAVLTFGLTQTDLDRLMLIPHVQRVVPLRDTEQEIIRNGRRATANAIATTADVFNVINLQTERGQYFTQDQYETGEAVCVLGSDVARQLFANEDPLGQPLRFGMPSRGTVVCTVIGVLKSTGLRAGSDAIGITNRNLDQDVYFPLTLSNRAFGSTISKREAGSMSRKTIELSDIWLKADHRRYVEDVAEAARRTVNLPITGLGAERNRNDVIVQAPLEILRKAEEVNRLFNLIMGTIAGFSLIVGGIGIMNIMLATVTERTREIGIRRALGAKRKHITLQFLIETTVISLTGGLVGITLGMGLASSLPRLVAMVSDKNFPAQIASWSVIGSFVISGVIGVLAGLYPAVKAAYMDPIDALRHE